MKNLIKITIGFIAIFFFKILNQFIKFKFFHLYTSRIGHLALNFDAALLSVKKNTNIIFITDKFVSNHFILDFFKKQKKVFFINSNLMMRIFYSVQYADPNSKLILNFNRVQPNFSFQFKYKSKINFPSYSKAKLNSILSKYNLKNNFVGFHARNDFYMRENKNLLIDKNYHGYRNFDFKDYYLAALYLKNKYSIIKLGSSYKQEKIENLKKVFKSKIYTSFDFESNEEIDYLINAFSIYNVIGSSGIDAVSSILRKKIVYVNLIPFNLNRLSYCSPNSIIIPKKVFDIKKNRLLKFKELLNINFNLHTTKDPYKLNDLKVIDNTPEEILNAIIEMEEKISDKNQHEIKKNNEKFWTEITKGNEYKINYLKNTLKLSISNYFLKNNKDLF